VNPFKIFELLFHQYFSISSSKISGSANRMARQEITSDYHVVLIIKLSKNVKLILKRISAFQIFWLYERERERDKHEGSRETTSTKNSQCVISLGQNVNTGFAELWSCFRVHNSWSKAWLLLSPTPALAGRRSLRWTDGFSVLYIGLCVTGYLPTISMYIHEAYPSHLSSCTTI
jgi:hypothetical protein